MRRAVLMLVLTALTVALIAVASSTEAEPIAGSNSANAKACQKGGYATLAPSEGPITPFTTEEDCVSYAARGGILIAWPPATNTPTNTPIPATDTPTSMATPTDTPADTPIPPTDTPTNTATPTDIPVPPTNTPTGTPKATDTPTETPTDTSTPSDTPTNTPLPPTSTPTATSTPVVSAGCAALNDPSYDGTYSGTEVVATFLVGDQISIAALASDGATAFFVQTRSPSGTFKSDGFAIGVTHRFTTPESGTWSVAWVAARSSSAFWEVSCTPAP
jgi:hypothetical protein